MESSYFKVGKSHSLSLDVFKEDHISSDKYQRLSAVVVGSYYKYKLSFSNPRKIIASTAIIDRDYEGRLIYDQMNNRERRSLHYRGEIFCLDSSFNIFAEDVDYGHSSELLQMTFRSPKQVFNRLVGIVTGIDLNGNPSSSKIILDKISEPLPEDFSSYYQIIEEGDEGYDELFQALGGKDSVVKVINGM